MDKKSRNKDIFQNCWLARVPFEFCKRFVESAKELHVLPENCPLLKKD